jgi:hypothetical protein
MPEAAPWRNLFLGFAYNVARIPLAAGVLYPFFGRCACARFPRSAACCLRRAEVA